MRIGHGGRRRGETESTQRTRVRLLARKANTAALGARLRHVTWSLRHVPIIIGTGATVVIVPRSLRRQVRREDWARTGRAAARRLLQHRSESPHQVAEAATMPQLVWSQSGAVLEHSAQR